MSTRSDIRCVICSVFLCLSGELPDWLYWHLAYDGPNEPVCAQCYDSRRAPVDPGAGEL